MATNDRSFDPKFSQEVATETLRNLLGVLVRILGSSVAP
jgi:hypothetical protein